MKIYRNGIWIGIWICIVSFLAMLFSKFFPTDYILKNLLEHINKINDFIFNLSLSIFCSAIVVVLTYIGAYRIEKKKTINFIIYYCSKYIKEVGNLIPLLTNELKEENIYEIKKRIESDIKINESVKRLLNIHEEMLLNVSGYFPFLKKNKNNLNVHILVCMLVEINEAIHTFDIVYKVNNNILYKNEIFYKEENLIEQLKLILQIDDNRYKKFLEVYKAVNDRNKIESIYNTNWKEKCF